ncbi:hypothetical protein [Ectopseudomonas khazarica]|uniref:hypothetical protein n=1 Tax=Ectopseudomonas khazarica TaxID=2502979 RepID=UPI002FDFAD98
MKDNLDLKILEILKREPASARLHNAVLQVFSEGRLPFESFSECVQKKSDNIRRLCLLPNPGKKVVTELKGILDEYAKANMAINSRALTSPQQIRSVTIPSPCQRSSLVNYFRAGQSIVRLNNAVIIAIEKKEFGSEILGDLEGKSIFTLRSELQKLPGSGKTVVNEFLDLLKTLVSGSVDELVFTESKQQSQSLQYELSI